MHLDVAESCCPSGQLVPPSQEVPRTCRDVDIHDAERRVVGLIQFGGQVDYATNCIRADRSYSAGLM